MAGTLAGRWRTSNCPWESIEMAISPLDHAFKQELKHRCRRMGKFPDVIGTVAGLPDVLGFPVA
jgi:hypothetical protein